MSPLVASDRIVVQCPCCATRARVPSAFAGRKVRCKECGQGVRVRALVTPIASPAPTPAPIEAWEGELSLVPVAEDERPTCPRCCARRVRGATTCMRCGRNGETRSRETPPRGRRPLGSARRAQAKRSAKEFLIPLALIAVGAVTFLVAATASVGGDLGGGLGLLASLFALGLGLGLWGVVSVATCLITGLTVFKTNYGRLDAAVVKLLAIGTMGLACAMVAVLGLGGFAGGYGAMVVSLTVTGVLAAWLFELTVIEAVWFTVLSQFVLPKLTTLALASALGFAFGG